jgi:hypothetical protein
MIMTTTLPGAEKMKDLVRPFDPIASVYLGATPTTAGADALIDFDLRLRAIANRLADEAATPSTMDAVRGYLAERGRHHPTALFVAGDRVLLAQEAPGAGWTDLAVHAAPAHLLPLLGWLEAHPPYVEVVTDRTGAEITAVARGDVTGHTTTVVGPDDVIERNAPGGWAQPRYRRRAEDSWRHNAGAVAEATARALHSVGADLLLVAGDVRAVQLLRERMPRRRSRIFLVPGGRRDRSEAARRSTAAAARAAYAQEVSAATLASLGEADWGVVVQGVDDTLAALAAGQVRTLLVGGGATPGRRAWFGPEHLCAARPDPPSGSPMRAGHLVDVAVRAAILTDARVSVVDPATTAFVDGIGAVCRYG